MKIKRPASPVLIVTLAVFLLITLPGCRQSTESPTGRVPATLRIGFGLTSGSSADTGIRQAARSIALETLVTVAVDGRPAARVAESWSVSPDGLAWQMHLRPSAVFHSGRPVDARVVSEVLKSQLPAALGSAFDDVVDIHAISNRDVEITLRRRSTFLIERLADVPIEEPGAPLSGTGPFAVTTAGETVEMRANDAYYGGRPAVDHIEIRPYTSVRSAWADLLRDKVDLLYDVGVDALNSLKSSTAVNVFTFQRGYAYMLLLNVRRPSLQDPGFRRELNAAVDRGALVDEVFQGHGTPDESPVWPSHWAYDPGLPRFRYEPTPSELPVRRHLKCLLVDSSHERLALTVQRQLQAIGVDLDLELVPGGAIMGRLQSGDFDAFLADFVQGPNMARPDQFWRSGGQYNFGHYSNKQVDLALDSIRHAATDVEYKTGVAAFQREIVNDPPAIFLTWRERARAVSRRFYVPEQTNTDMFLALHLWRPAEERLASRN